MLPLLTAGLVALLLQVDDVPEYRRADWPHWSDADRDCQDTRQEALIAESEGAPVLQAGGCRVARGVWTDPYTGATFTNPRRLDVDHMVPLGWAQAHGGATWTRERRERFANSLEDSDHLVSVSARANRQKGARGPDEWVPSHQASWCWYGLAWSRIVTAWEFTLSAEEAIAIVRLTATCSAAEVN